MAVRLPRWSRPPSRPEVFFRYDDVPVAGAADGVGVGVDGGGVGVGAGVVGAGPPGPLGAGLGATGSPGSLGAGLGATGSPGSLGAGVGSTGSTVPPGTRQAGPDAESPLAPVGLKPTTLMRYRSPGVNPSITQLIRPVLAVTEQLKPPWSRLTV